MWATNSNSSTRDKYNTIWKPLWIYNRRQWYDWKYLYIPKLTCVSSTEENWQRGSITKIDVNQFLGSYFLMSLVRMPSGRSYMKNGMRYSNIADVMPWNKFKILSWYINYILLTILEWLMKRKNPQNY